MAESFGTLGKNIPLLELARVLVRLNHVARSIVHANHTRDVRTPQKLGKADGIVDYVWRGIPARLISRHLSTYQDTSGPRPSR